MFTKKPFYTNVHSSITYNNPKLEATQMFINWWTDKQNVDYAYNGILFHHKNESITDTCYNTDEPWKFIQSKEARHKKAHIVWYYLYEVSRIGKSIDR